MFLTGSWGQCYKTFYDRKLRLFIISYSVCPWQAFPAQSKARSLPQSGAPGVRSFTRVCSWPHPKTLDQAGKACQGKVLHSSMLRPYPQTLDQAGKSCQGQTLQLITKVRKLRTKKFYNIGPRSQKGFCTYQKLDIKLNLRISNFFFFSFNKTFENVINVRLRDQLLIC